MNVKVHRYEEVKSKILHAVDLICDPVIETISPKGRNVIFESAAGEFASTNDGVTIAKSINVKDAIENAIIQIIKFSSLKTNTEVGDGTSTSILLSKVLIKEGFKLIENGWNPMEVKRAYENMSDELIERLKAKAIKIKTDKDLLNIARISSNDDEDIAEDVVKIVKVVGENGMVFLDDNNKPETEIEESIGFQVPIGLFSPDLRNSPRSLNAVYKNVPVLITDKRVYYEEEAETILKTVMMAGHKQVVIVARDFIGPSVNVFLANHNQGVCQVLLVKDDRVTEKDNDTLLDLAIYLGGKVISEKSGSLVDNLEFSDFVFAERAFADGNKTIIASSKKKNKALKDRVSTLKAELEKNKQNDYLKKRVASLTSGMVTVKVGGNTKPELMERAYRYEDAIQASRAALKDGYLVGGGVALMSLFDETPFDDGEIKSVFKKFCEASVRQIALNCGAHVDSIVNTTLTLNTVKGHNKQWKHGYNAVTGNVEDLLKSGVTDPYKVTEMAIRNSISVASQIISSNFLIVQDVEEVVKK